MSCCVVSYGKYCTSGLCLQLIQVFMFLTSVIHTMQKNIKKKRRKKKKKKRKKENKNGHNSCTVPTLWPSFRYFSRSVNSGNLECISYWDIKYFTATKLKREHHSFAFPCFMH